MSLGVYTRSQADCRARVPPALEQPRSEKLNFSPSFSFLNACNDRHIDIKGESEGRAVLFISMDHSFCGGMQRSSAAKIGPRKEVDQESQISGLDCIFRLKQLQNRQLKSTFTSNNILQRSSTCNALLKNSQKVFLFEYVVFLLSGLGIRIERKYDQSRLATRVDSSPSSCLPTYLTLIHISTTQAALRHHRPREHRSRLVSSSSYILFCFHPCHPSTTSL